MTGSSVRPRPAGTRAAWVGVAITLGIAACLGVLRASNDHGPLEGVVRGAVGLAALVAAPGLIGAIGAASGRRSLLFAAGIGDGLMSVLAFSGVTLVLLVPAALFLATAAAQDMSGRAPGSGGTSAIRPLLTAVVTVLVGVGGLLAGLGVGWLLAAALLGPVIGSRIGRHTDVGLAAPRPDGSVLDSVAGIAVVGAIVGLQIGAAIGLFGTTAELCWVDRVGPGGVVQREIVQASGSNSMTLGPTEVGGGCDSGSVTLAGLAIEGAAIGASLIVAGLRALGTGP